MLENYSIIFNSERFEHELSGYRNKIVYKETIQNHNLKSSVLESIKHFS